MTASIQPFAAAHSHALILVFVCKVKRCIKTLVRTTLSATVDAAFSKSVQYSNCVTINAKIMEIAKLLETVAPRDSVHQVPFVKAIRSKVITVRWTLSAFHSSVIVTNV